jgi:hypothetical protein
MLRVALDIFGTATKHKIGHDSDKDGDFTQPVQYSKQANKQEVK